MAVRRTHLMYVWADSGSLSSHKCVCMHVVGLKFSLTMQLRFNAQRQSFGFDEKFGFASASSPPVLFIIFTCRLTDEEEHMRPAGCEQCEKCAVCSILLATVLCRPELVNMNSVHTSGSVSEPRREVGLSTSHPTHEDRGGGGLFCCLSAGTRPVLLYLFSAWERRLATSCVQSHYPQPGRIHRNPPPPSSLATLQHLNGPVTQQPRPTVSHALLVSIGPGYRLAKRFSRLTTAHACTTKRLSV